MEVGFLMMDGMGSVLEMRRENEPDPPALVAVRVATYVPAEVTAPEIRPVEALMLRPVGRFAALKVFGPLEATA
jgi:hypothetical protein